MSDYISYTVEDRHGRIYTNYGTSEEDCIFDFSTEDILDESRDFKDTWLVISNRNNKSMTVKEFRRIHKLKQL